MTVLDWLFGAICIPIFSWLAGALQAVILEPLALAGVPVGLRVALVGGLVGLASLAIKRLLRVDEKERLFQHEFAMRRGEQADFGLVKDWKLQQVLYKASDQELDEMYNEFIAKKFAYFGMTYLVPIFLALYWLDWAYPREYLIARFGSPFAVQLPWKDFLPGLSVPACFFVGFLGVIFLSRRLGKGHGSKATLGKVKEGVEL